jgi:flavin-dependent dehydrogenase
MRDVDVDIATLGGGPAGTAAALTLRAYSGLRVAVVERSDYERERVGETVSPGLQPLLAYLGVWESFQRDGHLPAYGSGAAWGSSRLQDRDFLFTGQGDGWLLDRRRFDSRLADEVREKGGELFLRTEVPACEADSQSGWRLELAGTDGRRGTLQARFLIDATGKRGGIARRLGAHQKVFDRLVGVTGFVELPPGDRQLATLVESAPDGWWYSAPLPDGRAVVSFLSDSDVVRRLRLRDPAVWQEAIAATKHVRERVAGGRLASPLRVVPAHSRHLDPAGGPGWVAAGDAVASFDPLSSMGIGHAVSSGIHAARVAFDHLGGKGDLLRQYAGAVARNAGQYLALRRRFYLLEQRWPDRPFWSRRHQEVVM